MKIKHAFLAAAVAACAGGAWAAPSLQTCAPLEVNHNGGAGLSYTLACEAGAWRLHYAGSVPAGDEPVNAQYRLTVAGPGGASFTQNRVVRLPAPSRLGQMLVREAVLLDGGDLALRDCKEIGCLQYRPMSTPTNVAATAVTVAPEAKRLQDDQKRLTQEVEQLKQDLAYARTQASRDMEAAVEAERQRSAADLAQARAGIEAGEAKLAARVRAELEEANRKLDSERRAGLAAVQAERDTAAQRALRLEGEIAQLRSAIASVERERDRARLAEGQAAADLEAARKTLDQAMKLPLAQKAAYDFALADVVAQHNEQLAALQRAMPGTSFRGILDEIQIPKVNVDLRQSAVNIHVPAEPGNSAGTPAHKAPAPAKPPPKATAKPAKSGGIIPAPKS